MKLYKDVFYSILSKGVGAISAFVLAALIGRMYGVEKSGEFFYILTVISAGTLLTRLGLDSHIVRTVACSEKIEQFSIFVEGISKVLISSLVLAICAYLILNYSSGNFTNQNRTLLTLLTLGIIPWSLMLVSVSFLRGLGKFVTASLCEVALVPLMTVCFILINPLIAVSEAAYYYILSIFICFILIFVNIIWNINFLKVRKIKFCLPIISTNLLAVDLCNYAMVWLPIFGLGLFDKHVDVGLYNAAVRFGLITNIIIIGLNNYLLPKIALALKHNAHKQIESYCNKLVFISAAICIPLLLILIVFRGYFLSLFGDEFVAAGNIMIIICIGQLINIITGPVGHIIVMSGREKVIRNFTYQAVALNIVLFIVLGGYYGGVGAAVASFLSIFLFNFRCWYWVKNELEIVIRPKFTTIKIKETLL